MKILEKGKTLNNENMQVEDWSNNYSFMEYGTKLAVYARSKQTLKGEFSPKLGETYRFSFTFNNYEEAKDAFLKVKNGTKTLRDYKDFLDKKEFLDCI